MELDKRQKIITTARSWIDTKFIHQGRLKRTNTHFGGVDCLGFILGVLQEENINLKYNEDSIINYPLFTNDYNLLKNMDLNFQPKLMEEIQIADIILFKFNSHPDHLALVSEVNPVRIIHAYIQARKVVEHYLTDNFVSHIYKIYNIK